MNWYRWGKPNSADYPGTIIPSAPPPQPEQKYRMLLVTDTETYPLDDIVKSKCFLWCESFMKSGALLERDGEPILFIPSRRIMEIKFEKQDD